MHYGTTGKDETMDEQQQPTYRVLCVCLGNICRSPTAEVVLRHFIQQAKLNILVDSAGTSNYHPQAAADPRSQRMAQHFGYDLSAPRARQIQAQDFIQFDLILAMDQQNLSDLQQLANRFAHTYSGQAVKASLALMSEHDPEFKQQAIPDPYYGTPADFERVVRQCQSSSQGWIRFWQAQQIGLT